MVVIFINGFTLGVIIYESHQLKNKMKVENQHTLQNKASCVL